jgi:hypothetical protein
MDLLASIIGIGISVNTFVNVFWFFQFAQVNKRLERLENNLINKK